MSEPVIINVRETIGGPLCIATEDGNRVRERILPALRQGCRVTLSFAETDVVIPAFLSFHPDFNPILVLRGSRGIARPEVI